MKKLCFIIVLMIAVSFSASDGKTITSIPTFMHADDLLSICKPNIYTNKFSSNCTYYFDGVLDAYTEQLSSTIFHTQAEVDCYNKTYPSVSNDQVIRISYKYIEQNPKILNINAASLIFFLMRKNFPVPRECLKLKQD